MGFRVAASFGPGGRLPDNSHYEKSSFTSTSKMNAMRNVTKTTRYYGIKLG